MGLRAGLRVSAERDAVTVSAGMALAVDEVIGELPYVASAVVPVGPWRSLDERERELLFTSDPGGVATGRTVAVVRMPDELVARLRAVPLPAETTLAGAPIRTPEAAAAREQVAPALEPYVAREDRVLQGIRVQRGTLMTSTTHPFGDRLALTGMHLDRWHVGPDGCTAHGQLAINLGVHDRYLLFVNIPAIELAPRIDDPRDSWLTLPREVARRHADYPVVRVRVRPGEAYLAPTESVMHDVSLEAGDELDVCFMLRGRLRA
jgi:hypothetical protein